MSLHKGQRGLAQGFDLLMALPAGESKPGLGKAKAEYLATIEEAPAVEAPGQQEERGAPHQRVIQVEESPRLGVWVYAWPHLPTVWPKGALGPDMDDFVPLFTNA